MKKRFLIILSILAFLQSQAQQILNLNSGILEQQVASTVPTRDIVKLSNGYLVTYTFINALLIPDNLFSGTTFWKMDGFGMNEEAGEPCTLFRNDLISIPSGYCAIVEVTDSAYCDFDYELTPARQPLLDSDNEDYTEQNVFPINPYEGFKPATIVSQSGIQAYRGHSLCQIAVSPIQYNYNTRTVRAYTSFSYKVTFVPDSSEASSNGSAPRPLCLEDNFLTNNVIGEWQEETNGTNAESTSRSDVQDYLILSINTYSAAVNRFAEWKRLMGFNVHTVLRDDWTSESVMDTVSNAYANLPELYYLLIIGDHDDVPAKQSSLNYMHVTDFYYGCMDNDYIPEIYCGRLPVSTSDEAMNVVEKIIGYEQTPPTNSTFYNNALHCAYFQDKNYDHYADRRFAQTSEDVRTYVMSVGKTIQRVYKTPSNVTPLHWNNTFYSYGETIPNELKKPGFAWGGNGTDINNAINNGVFYVLHRDHGAVWGWGDPYYTQQHISNLSNRNLLPVVFSMNCLTGKFDENCFAETFLRKPNGGCVAIYGATKESYSGYNDALTIGMFDAIWPNPGLCINIPNRNTSFSITPIPTYSLGQILSQGMTRLVETYGLTNDTKYTKELFHCFGDPSMRIYTDTPTAFTGVSIVRNTNSVSVNLESGDTARITAYYPITGEVQSFIGNSVTITTPNPSKTTICVSAHNRIPFIQNPDILYIQNTNITGTLDVTHDVIQVGNHVTNTMETGNVTTTNADITLRAREVLLDSGTSISVGSTLRVVSP